MRPVHVSQNAYNILNRAFLTGCYFWIYDLEEENTFKSDPGMMEYLKDVIKLRKFWLETFGKGIYRDDRGIISSTENITAKTYVLNNNDLLIAVLNKNEDEVCELVLDTNGRKISMCSIYQLGGTTAKLSPEFENEYTVIKTKTKRLALIHLAF